MLVSVQLHVVQMCAICSLRQQKCSKDMALRNLLRTTVPHMSMSNLSQRMRVPARFEASRRRSRPGWDGKSDQRFCGRRAFCFATPEQQHWIFWNPPGCAFVPSASWGKLRGLMFLDLVQPRRLAGDTKEVGTLHAHALVSRSQVHGLN